MAIIESGVLFALALALLLGGTKPKLAIPASVILLALAWALTFSHAANWSHLDYVKSEPKSEVKTLVKTFTTYGMDEQERLIFHFAINTLEPELQKYVQAVTIVSNESYKKHESFKSSGHAHVRPGEICLLRGCDESQTIISWWHEAATYGDGACRRSQTMSGTKSRESTRTLTIMTRLRPEITPRTAYCVCTVSRTMTKTWSFTWHQSMLTSTSA